MGTVYTIPYIDSSSYGISPPLANTTDYNSCAYMRANGFLMVGNTSSITFIAKGVSITSGAQLACYSYSSERLYWIIKPNSSESYAIANSTTGDLNNSSNRSANWDGYFTGAHYGSNYIPSHWVQNVDLYSTQEEAETALGINIPIIYRLTNCTAPSAPQYATVGETVTVDFTFPDGYSIVNPNSDVYVTKNGVIVPSTYSNGVLTFDMP